MIKARVIIIPNEEILAIPIYCNQSRSYKKLIKQFLKENNLNASLDINDLLNLGCTLIIILNSDVICLIPSRLSEKQYHHICNLRSFFEQFNNFSGLILPKIALIMDKIDPNKTIINDFYNILNYKMINERKQSR